MDIQFVRKHVENFSTLFRGHPDFHGVWKPEKAVEGKKCKGESFVKRKPLTDDVYLKHLHGEQSIGIAPLMPDGKVYFMAIDIDVYPLKPMRYLNILQRAGLPFICFRSKSGGLHPTTL